MGPSGSGKSTLMHIMAGLDRPTSGSVSIDGTEITNLNDNDLTKLRRQHIGFIFQFFNLLPMLTAEENILLPTELSGRKPEKSFVDELIDKGRPRRPAGAPAGRALGRSAAARRDREGARLAAHVMFADEPTGNLDSTASMEILELLSESVQSYGQTTVMVTHDSRAAAIADRVLFLADGQIVRELGRCDQHDILRVLEEVAAL